MSTLLCELQFLRLDHQYRGSLFIAVELKGGRCVGDCEVVQVECVNCLEGGRSHVSLSFGQVRKSWWFFSVWSQWGQCMAGPAIV